VQHHREQRLIIDAWFVQNNGLQHVLQKCTEERENERERCGYKESGYE